MAKINLCRKNKRTFWGCRPKVNRGYRTMWAVLGSKSPIIYPPQIVAFYDACYGDGTDLRVGSEFVWSYADRDTPLIDDGAIVCDIAFTNELPSGAEDFSGSAWEGGDVLVTDLGGGEYQIDNLGSGRLATALDTGVQDKTRSILVRATSGSGETTLLVNNGNGILTTVTEDWQEVVFFGAPASTSEFYYSVDFRNAGNTINSIILKFPMLSSDEYLHNYIPPGTTQASTAGSSGGNGAAISMVEYVEQGDGVELMPEFSAEQTGYSISDSPPNSVVTMTDTECELVTDGAWCAVTVQDVTVQAGNTYRFTPDIKDIDGEWVIRVGGVQELFTDNTPIDITPTASSSIQIKRYSGESSLTLNSWSVQKLIQVPQPKAIAIKEALEGACTIATLCTMGVGSDEISVGEEFNISSTSDDASIPISYGKDATGSYFASSDGTNLSKVYATWDRADQLFSSPEVSADGSQFRIGYINITTIPDCTIDDMTWGSLVTFGGSFNPMDYWRLGYETTTPLNSQHTILSNIGEDAETLLALSMKYLDQCSGSSSETCTNSLDFSSECNSQYITVV